MQLETTALAAPKRQARSRILPGNFVPGIAENMLTASS
jgi:hypothetical protein